MDRLNIQRTRYASGSLEVREFKCYLSVLNLFAGFEEAVLDVLGNFKARLNPEPLVRAPVSCV